MSSLPLKKNIFDPNKIPPQKNTDDNFYGVQMTKCTKTLYQTDTIRPAVEYSPGVGVSLLYSRRSLHKADSMDRSFVSWDSGSARSAAVEPQESSALWQQLSHQNEDDFDRCLVV